MDTHSAASDISIRPLRHSDFKYVLGWSGDQKFCLANGWDLNRSEEEMHKWWINQLSSESMEFSRKGIEFGGRLVGYIDMTTMEKGTVELGIAIGESDLWGKGIGTKVMLHTIESASRDLGITTFHAETHEKNIRSRRMLEKMNFKEMEWNEAEEHFGTNIRTIKYKLSVGGA